MMQLVAAKAPYLLEEDVHTKLLDVMRSAIVGDMTLTEYVDFVNEYFKRSRSKMIATIETWKYMATPCRGDDDHDDHDE